jgi:hypothetical protein
LWRSCGEGVAWGWGTGWTVGRARDLNLPLRIATALRAWAQAVHQPLVVFLDEIDALADDTLISVLRKLRDGYRNRPQLFPWSPALIGLRDVRDYKFAEGTAGRLGTASPFNIKVESLTLADFTRDEVGALYRQHTDDSGQVFMPEATGRAFELTQGQPWLVNALARQAVEDVVPDRTEPITLAVIDKAKNILIQRQDTHLDSLAERLREPRVQRVIEPMLAGVAAPRDLPEDDIRYVVDLGLVRWNGGLEIANPIYGEIIPRALSTTVRAFLPRLDPVWLKADGQLDATRLLEAFLAFWRQHGESLMRGISYAEVAPQLVLMAFLDRGRDAGTIRLTMGTNGSILSAIRRSKTHDNDDHPRDLPRRHPATRDRTGVAGEQHRRA